MNKELLHKLQLQAGGSHYPGINPTQQELFAKLIVRECARYLYDNYPHSRYEVNYMRKHMGDPDWNQVIGDQNDQTHQD